MTARAAQAAPRGASARPKPGYAGRMPRSGHAHELDRLDKLATLLDSQWRVPLTNWRFGVDAVAAAVPVAGSLSTALVSAYMIKKAHSLGAPGHVLAKMVGNVAFDAVIGSVPALGVVADLMFKANRRNVAMLRRHFEDEGRL